MTSTHTTFKVSMLALTFWTLIVIGSLVWNIETHQQMAIIEIAKTQARTNINKDLAFRRWVTSHGGVYVRPTLETPPNRYLEVAKRDVLTTDNEPLTLMNPAYVMRQVMENYAEQYGVRGHLTAKKLINPANAPDEWEARAIDSFMLGSREVAEVVNMDGDQYMRVAQPLFMEQGCMKCHASLGIPVGGVRGAITTAIRLKPLQEFAAPGLRSIVSTHFAAWLIGLMSIWLVNLYVQRKEQEGLRLQAEADERLLYQATHDDLTGLANRRLLDDRLSFAIARAERNSHKIGVIYIDLDNFKLLNESYGYRLGDDAIKLYATRLGALLREQDTLARVGGDEFVALVECGDSDDIAQTAARIVSAANAPLPVGDIEIYLTTSIGVSLYPNDGGDIDSLMKHADAAMHRVKEQGRNAFQFFSDEMNQRAEQRVTLEAGIRRALEQHEFFLVYQPQVSLDTRRTVGFEALIRWRHATKGIISPAAFIPIAEESDLILRIGEWTIEEACRQLAAWRDAGVEVPAVSINIGARHFRSDDLVSRFRDATGRHGLAFDRLCVEITESALITHDEKASKALWELRNLGASISLDDFGTGYSSLSYLKRFPIQEVKIDKSFVDGIVSDANDLAIARAICAMASSLNMRTVAEGVEDAKQLAALEALGCDMAQGYFFARPMPAEKVADWLEAGHSATDHAPAAIE